MRSLRVFAFILSIAALPFIVGCKSTGGAAADTAEVRAERATLAKFIGAWDFEGWYEPADAPRRTSKGKAAGVLEHSHFVLLDTHSTVTEDGKSRELRGSILFSVAPGEGLQLSAWSDNSPALRQFKGTVENNGNRFSFKGIPAPGNSNQVRLEILYSSADRWTAEFTRSGKVIASYTFIRAK